MSTISQSVVTTLTSMMSLSLSPSSSLSPLPPLIQPAPRVATAQLVIALFLGISTFASFCFLRLRLPNIYMARFNHNTNMNKSFLPPKLPRTLLSWISVLHSIDDEKVLKCGGLDAYVFLGFFKMSIKLLATFTLLAVTIISPVRYHFTGRYDQDRDDDDYDLSTSDIGSGIGFTSPEQYKTYLWTYVIFTYLFTLITHFFLKRTSQKFIKIRQQYLGQQNSITDRTIRISGIPPSLRNEQVLKKHIESLNIGKVESIVICREWKTLNWLFKQRDKIITKLEDNWAEYLENSNGEFNFRSIIPDTYRLDESTNSDEEGVDEENRFHLYHDEEQNYLERDDISQSLLSIASTPRKLNRPTIKAGFFGLFGRRVDAIDYYTKQLQLLDLNIMEARNRHYSPTPTLFITMRSVANAQLVLQSVLDPEVNHCITRLAPSPNDIIWENACLPSRERYTKVYYITFVISVVSVLTIVPVTYLAALLNLKTISKIWPRLGEYLETNDWALNMVTGLLPTYIFTLLNVIIPFLYVWLSSKQGFISHSEEELSVVSKNFFYIFVNLFLVFTLAGTFSNFWGFLSDTTKIAYQLARSLRELSLFYVDLIILQGIGMMPFKLLLISQLMKFPISQKKAKTPRQFHDLYKPPLFNFGLQLPQPILILIITIIYSVMSTKILASGLAYFVIGYYVFKYQLIYSSIHPQHSTGKVWPLIFRRLVLGLLLFQLAMVGILALQKLYLLLSFLSPLPLLSIWYFFDFQRHYLPLNNFIALTAINDDILQAEDDNEVGLSTGVSLGHSRNRSVQSTLITPTKTIDERREQNQTFSYPNIVKSLEGPWLVADGEDILMADISMSEGFNGVIRKKKVFQDWETY